VLARKSVKQRFNPDERILKLIEAFRRMTNDCIRIGLAERKTSLKSLSLASYPKLKRYNAPSAYRLGAISRGSGILRNYRKLSKKHHVKEPFCTRRSLTTCYGLKIHTGKLRIPGNAEISLNTYAQRFLSQPGLEVRSVTLTLDRDVNAARNILTRVLRFKPVWSASEAMVQEPTGSEAILKVDADQSTWKAANQPTS
jgi:hypothetical protein